MLMTDEELKRYIDLVVGDAIKKLTDDGLIKRQTDIDYANVSKKLYEFYQGNHQEEIGGAVRDGLEKLLDDPYFRILPLYYGQQVTIEKLAVEFGVDISTIVRNKKRLCLSLNDMIKE